MLQPSRPYITLKFSLKLFSHPPAELTEEEYQIVQQQAGDEWSLQEKILRSPERTAVVIPEQSIHEAMQAVSSRYESNEFFQQDLKRNDMDIPTLASALEAELMVEAITAVVGDRAKPPSEEVVDAQFAKTNKEEPEQRLGRHILITINDDFPENSRQNAQARIIAVHAKTLLEGSDFSTLAERYSECPSALKGGSLGTVSRGRIYPILEETLFALQVGQVSGVVESDMGFHILHCEEVIPARTINKVDVVKQIRQILLQRARKKMVQSWLASL